ncbi:MAG: hypothetical protein NTZ27_09875 [Ignavibacteriales bacterium]|nr:hypothetical protein [Ignavibacteriales bacterium]
MAINIIFFVSVIIVAIIISKFYSAVQRYRAIKKLRNQWGKFSENSTDLEISKLLFQFKEKKESEDYYTLNDGTWNDLDMDEFLKTVDRTITPIGAQYLYDLLRIPLLTQEELIARENIINAVSKNRALREKIQVALLPLAGPYVKYLVFSLWTPLPQKPKYVFVFYCLSALAIWLLILVLSGFLHVGFIIIPFAVNSVVLFLNQNKLKQFLASFQYLAVLINVAGKIHDLIKNDFPEVCEDINKNLKPVRSVAYNIYSLQLSENNPIAAYFNIYFLSQITGFYSALNKIKINLHGLRKLFETVGYLDAMISIASYRKQFPNFTTPFFGNNSNHFNVKEIFHPLIVDPISNDFRFESKNILLTGSNMSGKTTFLKTIGINAVLAQTLNMCTAKKYEAPFLKIISSIERADDLMSGKSYYMAEVESILRIVNASCTNNINLFIIDEIFRGTNSVERTAASIEVLKYLTNGKDFTILATHDLQLTEILKENYLNYHFQEQMTGDGLHFDYKLHKGNATSKNAIALLEYVGYPKSIVDGAKRLIEK